MESKASTLPENYDELLALFLGFCQTMTDSLEVASGYDALIADELDSCGGNASYLDNVQRELSRQRKLLSTVVASHHSTEAKERFNLTLMLQTLAARLSQKLPGAKGIELHLDDNLYLEGNSYQLKNMFDSMLTTMEPLTRTKNGTCGLALGAVKVQIPKGLGALLSSDQTDASHSANEVIVIAIREADGLPERSSGKGWSQLKPYHELIKESISEEELFRNTRWIGTTMANGGRLFLDSSTKRPSAVMIFPICAADEGADELERYRWNGEGTPKTILVVDDEDMIWDVVMEMLLGLGYNVLLAGDGKEALEMYSANPGQIDLVVLDMLMPNMGGEEAFYLLKEIDPDVKVLISSVYVSQEEIQNVMDAGAVGFLRKPYRMVDLARKIHELLCK